MYTINKIIPSNYHYINRIDTNSYTSKDIMNEVKEWVDIISKLINKRPTYSITKININYRYKSTLGKTGKKGYIDINGNYLKKHSNPKNIHTTICHEVIHTFPGCFNHGPNFKAVGRYVENAGFDVHITRCGAPDPGYFEWLNNNERAEEEYKYKLVCEKCGKEYPRKRYSKIIKSPERYRCGNCHGMLKVCYLDREVTTEKAIANKI